MPAALSTFYALVASQTLSLIGSRMTAVALGLYVFTTTGLTTPLLLTAFFNELPGMVGGGLAGVLVDRHSRKAILLLTDLGQAFGSALLVASFLSGRFQLWHLYAVALLQGVFVTMQAPAQRATVTLLVPPWQRERANGLMELAFPLASVLAPLLAGLLYARLGVSGVIAVDLATFVFAAGVMAFLTIPRPRASAEGLQARGGWLNELGGGLRYLRQRKPLLGFMLFLAFVNFLLNGPLDLQIPYLVALTGSESQVGVGLAAGSLGALAGAALVTVIGRYRPRMRLILLGLLLCGFMFLVLGLARNLALASVALFLIIMPLPANGALFVSLLQAKVPPDLQGRVFALESQLALLGSTTSFLLVGPLVDSVVQPWAASPGWGALAGLLGAGPGAGIGLVLFVTGLLMLGSTALTFSFGAVRRLEGELPDHTVD